MTAFHLGPKLLGIQVTLHICIERGVSGELGLHIPAIKALAWFTKQCSAGHPRYDHGKENAIRLAYDDLQYISSQHYSLCIAEVIPTSSVVARIFKKMGR